MSIEKRSPSHSESEKTLTRAVEVKFNTSGRNTQVSVLLTALASLAAPVTNLQALEVNTPETSSGLTETPQSRAQAEATDIAIIAAKKGWTIAATARQMSDQNAFGQLVDAVVARFPATFSGAEFATSPGGKSYLRFKGAVPAEATTLAVQSKLNVGLTGNRKYSAAELENRALQVARFLAGAGYKNAAVLVLPNGTIDASVQGTAIDLPLNLRDSVRITFVAQEVSRDYHTYGGAYIHGASSACTTGFSVESLLTGTTGVTTAAHCSGMNHYHQPNTSPVIAYDTTFQDQHIGLSGDVEWHTTGHTEFANYYANVNDFREVNSVETSAAVNNTYCVYSRMQANRYCDEVYSTFMVQVSSSGVASDLIAMDDSNTVAGDSGGPWSYSTEAAGGVKGAIWVPFGWHDTWSKAWNFDSAINVEVMVQ